MEFTKYKCPVCDEWFKSGDDIVVCPECGTPHHRACYEKLDHCFYEDKHSDDFSFEELNNDASDKTSETEDNDDGFVTCPNCKTENSKDMFYCTKCGFPLNEQDRKNYSANNDQNNTNNQPFGQGMPPFGFGVSVNASPFDPMAGINSDEQIAENVTAGEMSKFVGKTTPYYMMVFNRIKKLGASKFNFSAFIFSGVYFIYRKMIALGIIISLLVIGLTVASTYIQLTPEYADIYRIISDAQSSSPYFYAIQYTDYLTTNEMIYFCIPYLLSLARGAVMIACGSLANRTYYKHCTKKINAIKAKSDGVNINQELENRGGVNLPLAISVTVAYTIINYLPFILSSNIF